MPFAAKQFDGQVVSIPRIDEIDVQRSQGMQAVLDSLARVLSAAVAKGLTTGVLAGTAPITGFTTANLTQIVGSVSAWVGVGASGVGSSRVAHVNDNGVTSNNTCGEYGNSNDARFRKSRVASNGILKRIKCL